METSVLLVVTLVAFYFLKTWYMNDLSVVEARDMIRKGAIVIDVRSEDEYHSSQLPATVNIPLKAISNNIDKIASNKDKVMLLHCRSGSRSFMGKKTLQRMGYSKVYNLGSFGRAKKIINEA